MKVAFYSWFFFLLIPLIGLTQECDSVPVVSLSQLQEDFVSHRITKNWMELTECSVLQRYVLTNKIDCEPCELMMKVDVDTSEQRLFLAVIGPEYSILRADSQIVQPLTNENSRAYYDILFPQMDTSTLKMSIWMKAHTSFEIQGYGADEPYISFIINRTKAYSGENNVFLFFLGALGLLAVINFIWFYFNRRKDILMYSIYVVLLFIYFLMVSISRIDSLDQDYIQLVIYCIQPLFYMAYAYFVRYFLETKTTDLRLHRILGYFIWFFLLSAIAMGIVDTFGSIPLVNSFFHVSRVLSGLIGIFTVIYLIFHPTRFTPFIVYGGTALLIGSLTCMALSLPKIQVGPILPIHWMMAGTAIELLFFAAGIGYRTKLNQEEKLEYQSALISEMKKNKELQESREEMLKSEVNIARKQIQLEEKEKMSAEFSVKELEIEMQNLRTQMNPHFIFNSLNSIKSFIAKNEPRTAADYLSKFAQLMRLILSNSKETSISMTKELEAVRIYIELEQMRFQKKFQFKIQILDDLNTDQIFIQPMILQPFVENAIWHGLMHKDGSGSLDIQISSDDEQILISIDDNGIGREKAASLANRRLVKKKSFGIKITKERLHHYYQDNYSLKWVDKMENGECVGTKVELLIPVGNEDYILQPKARL